MNNQETANAVAFNSNVKFDGAKLHVVEKRTHENGYTSDVDANIEIGAINGSLTIDNAGWIERVKAGVQIATALIKDAPGLILPLVKIAFDAGKECRAEKAEWRKFEIENKRLSEQHELELKKLVLEHAKFMAQQRNEAE